MLLNLLVVQPLLEAQAETREQFTCLQATLQDVPRLAGKVDILQDNSRSLLRPR
jgi:hypothetical protein